MRDEFGIWVRGTTFLNPNAKLCKMPTVIAGALAPFIPGSFVIAGTTITYATVAAYAIYTAGTMWALKQLAPDVPTPSSPDLSNRLQPDSPKQVIYGQTRVGGAITYIESADNNSNLLQVICIAGHPVEEIGDIYVNDTRVTNANVGGGSANGGDVDNSNWKSGSNIVVKVFKGNGSNNTAALSNIYSYTNNSDVDSTNFTGNGLSFLATNFEYHKDVFTNGVPTINAVVKGKKVYDPRKDNTSSAYDSSLGVSTHRKTTDSTWQYSNNPALCILDYITQDHGLNTGYDEIDDTEWAAEADICEDSITLADNSTQNRYELNGVFTRDMAPQEVIPAMLSSCGGSLFYAQGKWVLRVGKYRTPLSLVFDEHDLRSTLSIDTKTSRRDIFNAVTGKISSPDEDWIPTDYPMITSSTFETEDGGERNTLELPLPFTTNMEMAQRLAKQTLYKSREQIFVTAKFGLKAFQVRVGDNIKLTNSRLGWNQKIFEVVSWKFAYGEGAALEVELALKEISSAVYDWNAEETAFSTNNTTLPRYNYAPQPTFDGTPTTEVIIQSDGTTTANAEVAWTVTDAAYVNDYVLEWKRTSETSYQSLISTNLFARIVGVEIGQTYDLRISSRNRLGIQSDFSTTTVTIAQDTTAPSAPTDVSGSGGFRSNFITWTNPTADDFKEVQVYVNTSNTTSGATLLGSTAATEFVHGGLPESTTRYYFLKALDFTGNPSGFSTGTGAVTTQTDPADGATGPQGPAGPTGPQGPAGATGSTGANGGRYAVITYYQEASSTPSISGLASGATYTWSTGAATATVGSWSTTAPTVDAAGSNNYYYSNVTFIDSTGSASTSSGSSATNAVQLFNFNGLVTFTNTSGTTTLNNALADSSTVIDGGRIDTDTITADSIIVDNLTIGKSGNNIIIKDAGVGTTQIASTAVSIRGEYQSTGFTSTISNSNKYLIARVNSFVLTSTAIVEFSVSTLLARGGVGDVQLLYNTSAYGTPSYTTAVTPVGTAFAQYGTSIDIHGDSTSDARGEASTVIMRQNFNAGTYHFAVYGGRLTGTVQYRGISATVKVINR